MYHNLNETTYLGKVFIKDSLSGVRNNNKLPFSHSLSIQLHNPVHRCVSNSVLTVGNGSLSSLGVKGLIAKGLSAEN